MSCYYSDDLQDTGENHCSASVDLARFQPYPDMIGTAVVVGASGYLDLGMALAVRIGFSCLTIPYHHG